MPSIVRPAFYGIFVAALLLIPSGPAHAAQQSVTLAPGFVFFAPTVTTAPPLTSRALLQENPAVRDVFAFDEAAKAFLYQLRLPTGALFGDDLPLPAGNGIVLRCDGAATLALEGAAFDAAGASLPAGFSFRGFGRMFAAPTARGLLAAAPALRSVFRWNGQRAAFDFVLRLSGGTLFGDDFPLDAGRAYFFDMENSGAVSFGVPFLADPSPYFRDLAAVNPSPTTVTGLFWSDEPCRATVWAAAAGSFDYRQATSDVALTRTHALRVDGLEPSREYDLRFVLETASGSFAAEPGTGGAPWRVRTSAPASVVAPSSLAGRVTDGSGAALGGVAAVVSVSGVSSPLLAFTSAPTQSGGGIFFIELSNLKNASTGEHLPATPGVTEFTIDLYAPGLKSLGNRYILGAGDEDGQSPYVIPTPFVLAP